jgi:hypothetical protein
MVMKVQKEHIIGVVVGLVPIAAISIVFWNDDIRFTFYIKHCITIANSISLLLTVSDWRPKQ